MLRESFREVPVVDVQPLVDKDGGTASALADTAEAIGVACREVGFFYIENHGIDEAELDDVLDVARRFFDLPPARKHKLDMATSAQFRGYLSLGEEVTAGGRDWHECIDLQPWSERATGQQAPGVTPGGHPLDDPGQWPCDLPEFREVMMRAWDQRYALSTRLSEGLALSLGLKADHFAPYMGNELCALRLSHYPPPAEDPDEAETPLGMGAHHDNGFLAVLQQDEAGGLEVRNADGDWIAAPHRPGALLVNVGLMMQRWTNDRYRATWHRVQPPRGRHRYSAPFFFEPRYEAVIEPLAVCCGPDNPPRYRPCTFGPFLDDEFTTAYDQGTPEREDCIASDPL